MDVAQQLNAALVSAVKYARRGARRARAEFRRAEPWQLALYAILALLALWILLPLAGVLAVAAVIVGGAALWAREFVTLMRLDPAAFPGRHDRSIWIGLMILLPPLGLLAFWLFRRNRWPEVKGEDEPGFRDWL